MLLVGATALIVSCSSDEEQDDTSEAKEYAYTPDEMQKIQTFMDEYDVNLPGLVTSSAQPLPTVDDMLDLVKAIASMQTAVSHPVDMIKNTVTFSNMAKNNLMMSSEVETYSGSVSGEATEKGATIKYGLAWKNVDTSGRYGQVELTSLQVDDSRSNWSFNYIGFSYGFSGAYTFNYTLNFIASKKSAHYSCPFTISGSCNMFSGR